MGYSLPQVFRGGVAQTAQMSSKGLSAENCSIKTKFSDQILDMTKMMLTIIPAWVLSTQVMIRSKLQQNQLVKS